MGVGVGTAPPFAVSIRLIVEALPDSSVAVRTSSRVPVHVGVPEMVPLATSSERPDAVTPESLAARSVEWLFRVFAERAPQSKIGSSSSSQPLSGPCVGAAVGSALGSSLGSLVSGRSIGSFKAFGPSPVVGIATELPSGPSGSTSLADKVTVEKLSRAVATIFFIDAPQVIS